MSDLVERLRNLDHVYDAGVIVDMRLEAADRIEELEQKKAMSDLIRRVLEYRDYRAGTPSGRALMTEVADRIEELERERSEALALVSQQAGAVENSLRLLRSGDTPQALNEPIADALEKRIEELEQALKQAEHERDEARKSLEMLRAGIDAAFSEGKQPSAARSGGEE